MRNPEQTLTYEREPSMGMHYLGEEAIAQTVTVVDTETMLDKKSESSQDIQARNKERIKKAIGDCEVEPTHEVRGAIADYYDDHEKMITVLHQIFDGSSIDIASIIDDDTGIKAVGLRGELMDFIENKDNPNKISTAHRLSGVVGMVYKEVAVGATTIGEDEYHKVYELRQAAEEYRLQKLNNAGHRIDRSYSEIRSAGENNKDTFWKDARQAGQLLFHNTSFGKETVETGFKLATRKYQKRTTGNYVATTADSEGHSQTLHFTEVFDTDGYKQVTSGGRGGKETLRIPTTIAVPIAEVIKTTPYARGGRYGEVTLRPDSSREVAIHSDVLASTSNWYPNTGADDIEPGSSGLDRVFYADNVDRAAGEDYAYTLDHTAHYIRLQRDIDDFDRKTVHGENGMQYAGQLLSDDLTLHGNGKGYPVADVIDFDYSGRGGGVSISAPKPGEKFMSEDVEHTLRQEGHLGPMAAYKLSDPRFHRVANEHYSYSGKTKQENDALLRSEVARLQQESCNAAQFQDKLVVLLRGNDTAFETKG